MKIVLLGPEPSRAGAACPDVEGLREAVRIEDPVEFLERVTVLDPQVVITSPALPVQDARAVAVALRTRPEGERIALLGWAPRAAHAALFEAGFDGCLALEDSEDAIRRELQRILRLGARFDAARARYEQLLDNLDDIVYANDVDGRYTYVSAAAERILGWRREELLGRSYREFVAPEGAPQAQEALAKKLRGEARQTTYHTLLRARSGELVPVEVRSVARYSGERVVESLGVVRDLRDEANRERAAHIAEQRYRLILEAIPDAVARFDANDVCVEWKPGVPAELYPRTDFEGKHAREIMGPLAEATVANFAAVRRTGKPIRTIYRGSWGGREGYYEARILPFVEGEVLCVIRDISEERAQERELLRLAAVVQSSQDAIIVRDREGRIVLWNRGAQSLYGYAAEEVLGRTAEFLMPPGSEHEARGFFERALRGEELVVPEALRRTKSGELVPVSLSFFPVRDEEGRVRGVAGIGRDLRPLKALQEAAAATEANYRAIVERASDAIWVAEPSADGEWLVTYANPKAEELVGLGKDEQIGRRVREVLGEAGWREVEPYYRLAVERREPVQYERTEEYERTGEHRVHTQLTPVVDDEGRVVRIIGSTRDVTALYAAARARHELEERLRVVLRAAPAGLLAWDRELRVTAAEGALLPLAGLDPGDVVGRPLVELPLPRAALRSAQRALSGHGEFGFLQLGDRIVQVRSEPVRDEDGHVVGGVAVAFDVTEQRRTEEALAQIEKMESLGTLAGGVAHDFNNLLVAILGNASLARGQIPPDSPAQELLQEIHAAAQRAAELSRQMLAYAGKARISPEIVDLNALLRDLEPLLQSASRQAASLRLELAPEPVTVRADPTQIRQVVMNLVLNAADAMDGRFGSIVVRTGVREFGPEALRRAVLGVEREPGRYALLEVSDTGHGMDAATMARIFDPFFSTKFTGRGLGLAAVLGIVRGHGGAIFVESAPGQGSTFTVVLPALAGVPQPAGADGGEEPEDAGNGAGKGTILVVDDDVAVRRVTERALSSFGYRTRGAGSGEEALELLRALPVRAVLVDFGLPGTQGTELVRRIRELLPDVPIAVVTGMAQEDVAQAVREAGADLLIAKPYGVGELRQAVERLLATRPRE